MRQVSKRTAFVAGFPDSTPADAILVKAKAQKISLTRDQVHRIRWNIRKRNAKASASKLGRRPGRPVMRAQSTDRLRQLRSAMLCAGIDASARVLDELRRFEPVLS